MTFWCFFFGLLMLIWLGWEVELTPIVGGQVVHSVGAKVKYPYVVSLQDRLDNGYRHFCGGSLISSFWILTAAHCAWRKKLDKIVAVIGCENISAENELKRYALERVEFIYFQPTNYQNDIALLRLRDAYDGYIAPSQLFQPAAPPFARLPKYGMKANRKRPCKIIGYGATQEVGAIQTALIEGEVNVITKKQCRQLLGHIWAPENGENMVCAMGRQDTCQGDSGGPLICSYNGQDYVYGIVSHGLTCGLRGIPSVYTVTIPYVEWIDLIVND